MEHYMGKPPATVSITGNTITPQQYLKDVLGINPDDYVDILSYTQEPFYKQVEYSVPDNWWYSADYYNVPLDDFMEAMSEIGMGVIYERTSCGKPLRMSGNLRRDT